MKLLKDYTHKELVAFTSEEINDLVKRECVDRGLMLSCAKPVKPEPIKTLTADLFLSEFPSFTCDRASGDKIQKIIQSANIYDKPYNKPYYTEIHSPTAYNYPKVTNQSAYSQDILAAEKLAVKKLHLEWDIYNDECVGYNEWTENATKLVDEIHEAIREAHNAIRTKEQEISEYKEYLKLANNDTAIAEAFYKKRYGNDATIPTLEEA